MKKPKLTSEQKQIKAEIKRINTRIRAIEKQFGVKSATYRKAVSRLQRDFGDFIHYTESTAKHPSIVQITQTKANIERTKGKKSIQDVLNVARYDVKTKTQMLKPFTNSMSEDMLDGKTFQQASQLALQDIANLNEVEEDFLATKEMFYEYFTEKERENIMTDMYGERGKASAEDLGTWARRMRKKVKSIRLKALKEKRRRSQDDYKKHLMDETAPAPKGHTKAPRITGYTFKR